MTYALFVNMHVDEFKSNLFVGSNNWAHKYQQYHTCIKHYIFGRFSYKFENNIYKS